MNRIQLLCGGVMVLAFLWSCQQQESRYRIQNDQIGDLTPTTTVAELSAVFSQDSVVDRNNSSQFSNRNEIVVYDKGSQRELLRLHPKTSFDSTSTIATVQVMDTLFKTPEGLGIGTAFEDLSAHYKIKRIENTLGTAMIFLEGIPIYVDIDKSEIYEPTQMGVEIEASQIKRRAKVKHLWLDWED